MDFLIAMGISLYFLMFPYTLGFLGFFGLGTSLYISMKSAH